MVFFRGLALVTALMTLFLIIVGGVVRVSGSGLGCPDWPTCHGQIVPPLVLQSIIEFTHRFTASVVSLLVVVTGIVAWRRFRSQRWLIVPATLGVALLVVQIALGAFTVELELTPALVTAHLGTALALFATTVVTAAAAWRAVEPDRRFQIDGFAVLGLVTVALTFSVQLLGAFVIKGAASFSCDGWPLCAGGFGLPNDAAATLNLTHRLLAAVVAFFYVLFVVRSPTSNAPGPALSWHLYGGLVLLAAQIVVGAGVVLWRVPPFTAALHLALAAAFWGNLVATVLLTCFPTRVAPPVPLHVTD
jgi:heme A synthase